MLQAAQDLSSVARLEPAYLQPILLVDGPLVNSMSPQGNFLHSLSEHATLGVDRPETRYKLH